MGRQQRTRDEERAQVVVVVVSRTNREVITDIRDRQKQRVCNKEE